MSNKHPVIAVTGIFRCRHHDGKTSLCRYFFRRETITAAIIEGDKQLAQFDRIAFRAATAEAAKAGNNTFSHFGPEANHFDKIEGMFKAYGETGHVQTALLRA